MAAVFAAIRRRPLPYGFARVASAAATAATLAPGSFGDIPPSPPLMFGSLVVAWVGFAPAVLAVALSTIVLDHFFLRPCARSSSAGGAGCRSRDS
jgi:hypothetical protein